LFLYQKESYASPPFDSQSIIDKFGIFLCKVLALYSYPIFGLVCEHYRRYQRETLWRKS